MENQPVVPKMFSKRNISASESRKHGIIMTPARPIVLHCGALQVRPVRGHNRRHFLKYTNLELVYQSRHLFSFLRTFQVREKFLYVSHYKVILKDLIKIVEQNTFFVKHLKRERLSF